jgi:hypothetical protein
MGVDAGDVDGDGWLDFVLTTFAHDTKTLYRNLGRGLFTDATQPAGLGAPTFEPMGWGTALFDADLDGQVDLFITATSTRRWTTSAPKETYKRRASSSGTRGQVPRRVGDGGRRSTTCPVQPRPGCRRSGQRRRPRRRAEQHRRRAGPLETASGQAITGSGSS